jgi:uncharacterized protein
MLDLKPVELKDKDIINSFLHVWEFENSELHFTNLFIWQESWNIRFAVRDECLFVTLEHDGKSHMFVPIPRKKGSDMTPALRTAREYFKAIKQPLCICCVTEELLQLIRECCNDQFNITPDRDNFDYIYLSDDLIELPGKKYHAKRNHLKNFLDNQHFEYSEISNHDIEDCKDLCRRWISSKGGELPYLEDEYIAINRALAHMDELGLSGGMIRIDGKPEAFTIGEKIRHDMAVIHFEKANAEIQGLYAAINNLYANDRWRDVRYINREEDMGIEGLRRSKMSYHPVRLVTKYYMTGADDIGSHGA